MVLILTGQYHSLLVPLNAYHSQQFSLLIANDDVAASQQPPDSHSKYNIKKKFSLQSCSSTADIGMLLARLPTSKYVLNEILHLSKL